MRRAALLVLLLLASVAMAVAVWWATTREEPPRVQDLDTPRGGRDPADPTLTGREVPAASHGATPEEGAPSAGASSEAAARLADALARLHSVRAGVAAAAATPQDVDAAERAVWLARVEAGETSEKDAYAEIARIDEKALTFVEALHDHGRSPLEEVLLARVRLHQSKKRAGHTDERFDEFREAYMRFIARDHAENLAAGMRAPDDLHRRVLDACREFPLAAGDRDEHFERAGAALRDALLAEIRQWQEAESDSGAGAPSGRRTYLELELWDLRLSLREVDFHTAHGEKARIYEQVFEEMRSRRVGVLPTKLELKEAELKLHREKFLLGEEDQEYGALRKQWLRGERRRLNALVSSGRLDAGARAKRLEAARERYPTPEILRTWISDD